MDSDVSIIELSLMLLLEILILSDLETTEAYRIVWTDRSGSVYKKHDDQMLNNQITFSREIYYVHMYLPFYHVKNKSYHIITQLNYSIVHSTF